MEPVRHRSRRRVGLFSLPVQVPAAQSAYRGRKPRKLFFLATATCCLTLGLLLVTALSMHDTSSLALPRHEALTIRSGHLLTFRDATATMSPAATADDTTPTAESSTATDSTPTIEVDTPTVDLTTPTTALANVVHRPRRRPPAPPDNTLVRELLTVFLVVCVAALGTILLYQFAGDRISSRQSDPTRIDQNRSSYPDTNRGMWSQQGAPPAIPKLNPGMKQSAGATSVGGPPIVTQPTPVPPIGTNAKSGGAPTTPPPTEPNTAAPTESTASTDPRMQARTGRAIRSAGRQEAPPAIPKQSAGQVPPQPTPAAQKPTSTPAVPPPIEPIKPVHPASRPKPVDPDDGLNDHETFQPHKKPYPAPQSGDRTALQYDWHILGASVRGREHENGKYRDDDFSIYVLPHSAGVLVAIADGVSRKPYSRRGAHAAVQGAAPPDPKASGLEPLSNLAAGIADAAAKYKGPPNEFESMLQRKFGQRAYEEMRKALSRARDAVEQAARDGSQQTDGAISSADDLQSTLLVFLAVPHCQGIFVASVQVGDGALFGRLKPGYGAPPPQQALGDDGASQGQPQQKWTWLQMPQIQAAGNEVQPFMRSTPTEWEKWFSCEPSIPADVILGMTDGIYDDIEPPRRTPENPTPDEFENLRGFYDYLGDPPAGDDAEKLLDLIDYEKPRSRDDRTLVCLYHRQTTQATEQVVQAMEKVAQANESKSPLLSRLSGISRLTGRR